MGAYLSKPVTDKVSEDTENERMMCGASSMQGWREFQEDAHNCILDFDSKASFFGVYDGHGGAEVAHYTAKRLPDIVKNELYEKGDYENALIKAFLDFDETLTDQTVIERLTAIREKLTKEEVEEDLEEESPEELNELYEEAEIPIDEILKKYRKYESPNYKPKVKDNQPCSSKSFSSTKPMSSDEVKTNDDSIPSSSTENTDNIKEIANGVDESKPEDTSETAKSSSSIAQVNGTSSDDKEAKTEETVTINSDLEVGPSSSSSISSSTKKQNGNETRSMTSLLINDGSEDEDSEDDDDDDDDMFEVNDESDEDSDDDDDESVTDELTVLTAIQNEEDDELAGQDSGCTAVVALLVNNKLYVANAGDSRCVVSVNGKAHDMSKDHKPEDEPEAKRIYTAGGRITGDGRINGGLNLSRALGDHSYKKNTDLPATEQMIVALPDVSVLDIEPGNNNFLVLACDGIWNSLSSQEVVDFVLERINKPNVKLSSICEELFDHCLAPNTLSDGTGCDNMTCIIAKFKHNQKRSHSDDENDKSCEGVECKKLKSDSTEPESVH